MGSPTLYKTWLVSMNKSREPNSRFSYLLAIELLLKTWVSHLQQSFLLATKRGIINEIHQITYLDLNNPI